MHCMHCCKTYHLHARLQESHVRSHWLWLAFALWSLCWLTCALCTATLQYRRSETGVKLSRPCCAGRGRVAHNTPNEHAVEAEANRTRDAHATNQRQTAHEMSMQGNRGTEHVKTLVHQRFRRPARGKQAALQQSLTAVPSKGRACDGLRCRASPPWSELHTKQLARAQQQTMHQAGEGKPRVKPRPPSLLTINNHATELCLEGLAQAKRQKEAGH